MIERRNLTMISVPAVLGLSSRYNPTRCLASIRSLLSSILSSTRYKRSKREMRVGGRSMLRVMGQFRLYLDPTGFAAARIEVRAFRVVMIPAFAIDTVCCSYRLMQIVSLRRLDEEEKNEVTNHDFVKNTSSSI